MKERRGEGRGSGMRERDGEGMREEGRERVRDRNCCIITGKFSH